MRLEESGHLKILPNGDVLGQGNLESGGIMYARPTVKMVNSDLT